MVAISHVVPHRSVGGEGSAAMPDVGVAKVMPTGLDMSLIVSSRCSILMEVPALTVVTIDSPLEYGRSTARSTAGC